MRQCGAAERILLQFPLHFSAPGEGVKKLCFVLLVLAAPIPSVWGICNLPPPAPTPDPPDSYDFPDSGAGTPMPTPTPPGTPSDPGARPPRTPDSRGGGRTRSAGASYDASWHVWWELNREYLLGFRQAIRRGDVISGGPRDPQAAAEALAVTREEVRATLRDVAKRGKHNELRAASLRALGRVGNDEDARLFLRLLRTRRQPGEVLEAAAVGLGCLERIEAAEVRDEVRAYYRNLLAGDAVLSGRSRMLAVMAVSLRIRDDRALGASLAARCTREMRTVNEAAAILYSCGLARDPLVAPALLEAVREGALGKQKLHDVARSHAALALAMAGDTSAIHPLVQVLRSRRAKTQTRRGAALAVGLMLRRDNLEQEHRKAGQEALLRAFDKSHDPLVRAFCAVGMGTAHRPFGISVLKTAVPRSSNGAVRPYAALALGLAARRLEEDQARKVRGFLFRELGEARDIQLAAALSIALGVCGAEEAKDHLFKRLARKNLKASLRGPAIQGLGLLGDASPEIDRELVDALDNGPPEVVEDAALALGFLGRRSTARLLVRKLQQTLSEPVQAHMVVALSHLGSTAAVEPLLALLKDESRKHTVRESAAAALGILVEGRPCDPLFEIDAFCNPYGLTPGGRALVLVY
jgi:HEAT repeat protein